MNRFVLTVMATMATSALAVAQDPDAIRRELDELKVRIGELEDQQADVSDRIGERAIVQAYTAHSLDFGGHATSLFTYMKGDQGEASGHVVTLLELYLRAQIDDEWSLFATPGFYTYNIALLDDPTTTAAGDPSLRGADTTQAKTFLSRVYGQWKPSDLFQFRGGLIGSPHGTTNREYFIPARMIGQGNLHSRVFMANQLYPQVFQGLSLSGKIALPTAADWIEYDAYVGVEDDSPSEPMGGGRLAYVFGDWGLSTAVNYGRGSRAAVTTGSAGAAAATAVLSNVPNLQSPFATRVNGGRDYEFVGIDVDWRRGSFISKTEAYISAEDSYRDQRAFSTEWTYFVTPEWGMSYRFDYYDAGSDLAVTALSPFAMAERRRGLSTEHVVGVSYNPSPSVRIRLDAHHNNLPNSDESVDFLNFSWSISF